MSMSLIYHAFGLKGVKYRSTKYKENTIIFSAVTKNQRHKCPECGCRWAKMKGRKTRSFRMGLIGRKHGILNLELHRLQCRNCDKLWWPRFTFMVGNHRYTRSFALTVLDLLRFGTVQAVAHLLDVGWDLVKEIHKSKLQSLYRKIPLYEVKDIGIDEFSIKKGHNYMTLFTDLSTGRILHAVEGKGKEDILPFMKKLARKAKNLKAIAMDMSSAFFWSVREVLPHVDVVFDRYHVSALMNRAVDDLRRESQRQLEEEGKGAFLIKQDARLLNQEVATTAVERTLSGIIQKHALSPSDITWFLPHYSSEYFRPELYDHMKSIDFEIPPERWFTNLAYKGNTGAASIYIILEEFFKSDRIKRGDRILCFIPESGRFSMCYMMLTAV